jgi:hypothetical protein
MKEISEEQQKALDELYVKYYTYLCVYELGYPFVPYDKSLGFKNQFQWYHKNDFRQNLEEEAHSIKVNFGY